MNDKKENQRVRLTKRLLKDALVDLLLETPLQRITITQICSYAQINRTTFYKYYANECDLYADLENDFIAVIAENLDSTPIEGVERLLALIQAYSKIAVVMINNSSEEKLSRRIFSLPEVRKDIHFKKIEKSEYSDEFLLFIFSGAYAVIKRWINNGFVQSPREMAAFLNRTIDKMMR